MVTLKDIIKLQEKNAKTYLSDIHNDLTEDALIDFHTFFYHIGQEKCPVCQYRLTTKIELIRATSEADGQ